MNAPEVSTMPLADLAPAPYNPRTISKKAAAGLRASIKRFGLVQPIVFNRRSGHVVGGHQRIDALKTLGETAAQVVVVDLPESEEKALNVTLNNPGVSGEFSKSIGALIGEIKLALPSLDFDELRFDELADPPAVIEDEVPEPPKVPVTKPGDLWVLGRHRVLCGDATKAGDVGRVLGQAKPFLMVTDPPYGVEYDPTWRDDVAGEFGQEKVTMRGQVANDDRADWLPAWELFPGRVAYVWHSGLRSVEVYASLVACGFVMRGQIIWAKPSVTLSRGAYHWQHEPCWYAARDGSAMWAGDRKQSTLWAIAGMNPAGRGTASEADAKTNHGTQKPVECMARPIRNHDCSSGVYDPFLGSGTTLIAAEQLDRVCYGLEIEPRYCDVIVERWQNLTGKKAKRAA